MDLNAMDPKELIGTDYFEDYKKETNALVWQIIQLNYNLFFLEKIVKFPFRIFRINPLPFWHLITDSLFETSVMIIWRLVDKNEKTLSLFNLKNKIKHRLIKKEYQKQFTKELERIKFDNRIASLRTRVEQIRHNRLAHFNRKWIIKPTEAQIEQSTFSLFKLKELRDSLISLFQFLRFGVSTKLFYQDTSAKHEYPYGYDKPDDFEKLLDAIIKESEVLNLPENNKTQWLLHKKRLSQRDIKVFNSYRKKFHLTEV